MTLLTQADIDECLKREPARRAGALEDDPEYKLVVASNELIQVGEVGPTVTVFSSFLRFFVSSFLQSSIITSKY